MKTVKIYGLYKDGKLHTDTHFFMYNNVLTALVTYYLFCLSYACKDFRLVCYGEYDFVNNKVIMYEYPDMICHYESGINYATELLTKYKGNTYGHINVNYFKDLMTSIDNAIVSKFSSDNVDTFEGELLDE